MFDLKGAISENANEYTPCSNTVEEETVFFEDTKISCNDSKDRSLFFELTVYADNEEFPIVLSAFDLQVSRNMLLVFDRKNRVKASFVLENIIGYSIRYLED